MIIFDAFIRFSGIGLLLLLAVLTFRDFRKWQSAPYLILACISISAAFFGFAPSELRISGMPFITARFMDVPHLVFVWLFALSLFDNHFRLSPKHIFIGLCYCAPIFWARLYDLGFVSSPPVWLDICVSIFSIGLMVHLCAVTIRGRRDDLLERRRASRIYFVVLITFVTLIAAISEPLMPYTAFPNETFKIMSMWPGIIWGVYWMTSFEKGAVTFSDNETGYGELSERDKILRTKLDQYIIEQEAFKDPSMTIVSLAAQLGVSQYRLRSLINQSLGYPNFSSYINKYRINSVKSSLSDPKNTHVPILKIAMDSGFNSLSPFNRAFRDIEGTTPSVYRQNVQRKSAEN